MIIQAGHLGDVQLRSRTVLALGLALAVLAGFVGTLGVEEVIGALTAADPLWAGVAVIAALASLLAWSVVFGLLIGTDGETDGWWASTVLYAAATFPKNVLPAGHASGPVVTAYLYSRRLDREYAQTLAQVSMGEVVNTTVSIGVAVAGLGGLFLVTPPSPERHLLAVSLGSGIAVLGVVGGIVWLRRDVLRAAVAALAYLLRESVGRVSTRVEHALEPERVSSGVARFGATFTRASGMRRTLAVATLFSLVGWAGFVLALFASGLAVGKHIPLTLAAFLVPASGIAGAIPLPGGLGGFEIGFTAVLVAMTGMAPETAVAATLIYRVATYWAITAVSGVAALSLSLDVTVVPEDGAASTPD